MTTNRIEMTVREQGSKHMRLWNCHSEELGDLTISYDINSDFKTVMFATAVKQKDINFNDLSELKHKLNKNTKFARYNVSFYDNEIVVIYIKEISRIFGYRRKLENYTKLINDGISELKNAVNIICASNN